MRRVMCNCCNGKGRLVEDYDPKYHGLKHSQWFIHPAPNGRPAKASKPCPTCWGAGSRVYETTCGVPLIPLRAAA